MLEDIVAQTAQQHESQFGVPAQWLASAPGRVNLIGDHTDYTGGFAMPFAIDRHTVVTASPLAGSAIQVHSSHAPQPVTLTLGAPEQDIQNAQWHDYVRGVLTLMRKAGCEFSGLALTIHGNLPIGSGLSSSASLELAVATLVEGVSGKRLDTLDKILLCQQAEHQYANMPCGILDQYTVCKAQQDQLLLLDCRAQSSTTVSIDAAAITFVVFDSQIRHQHSGGDYAQRARECAAVQAQLGCSLRDTTLAMLAPLTDQTLRNRAAHVVTENARVDAMAQALANGAYQQAGEIMLASHHSLRDDYQASVPQIDQLVDIAHTTEGVYGARMTGGGFGGSVIAMLAPEHAATAAVQVQQRYQDATGLRCEPLTVGAVAGCALQTNPLQAK